jgi:sugar fermentation stimulation protein A
MREVSDCLSERGCYSLLIHLRKRSMIRVGRLGKSVFPPGVYLYTGSAMNGLRGRLSHHLRKRNKKSRWHIDYLLKCPGAQIKQILVYPPAPEQECRQNRRISALPGAQVILKGFGSSDCGMGCGSHLFYLSKTPKIKRPAVRDLTRTARRTVADGESLRRAVWRR